MQMPYNLSMFLYGRRKQTYTSLIQYVHDSLAIFPIINYTLGALVVLDMEGNFKTLELTFNSILISVIIIKLSKR